MSGTDGIRERPPLPRGDASVPSWRRQTAWSAAIGAASLLALVAAGAHGRGARTSFTPPPELNGQRVLSVKDAAEAVLVWRSEGVRGRVLVVLTGRWTRPTTPRAHFGSLAAIEERRAESAFQGLDEASALYVAANAGIARRIEVVMPPAAFATRRAEVSGMKGFAPEPDAFSLPHEGYGRRFSTPAGFNAPPEPVLVLVEPSWFAEGAPADPLAWLAARGLATDLAMIARKDSAAPEGSLGATERYASSIGAVRAEFPR